MPATLAVSELEERGEWSVGIMLGHSILGWGLVSCKGLNRSRLVEDCHVCWLVVGRSVRLPYWSHKPDSRMYLNSTLPNPSDRKAGAYRRRIASARSRQPQPVSMRSMGCASTEFLQSACGIYMNRELRRRRCFLFNYVSLYTS